MGLSAPRSKTKISQDPNNTSWSRSTDRFGHKILTAQGWTPGDTLGAKNACHAEHYTTASSSHIRVFLRDDNLGIGARKNGSVEQFGLDMFAGLLGRLNGKSDTELLSEEARRRDARLAGRAHQKYGLTSFVFGGYLVGDKIEKSVPALGQVAADGNDNESCFGPKGTKRKRPNNDEVRARTMKLAVNSNKQTTGPRGRPRPDGKDAGSAHQDREFAAPDPDSPDVTPHQGVPEIILHSPTIAAKAEKRRQRAERKAQRAARRENKQERRRKRAAAASTLTSNVDVSDTILQAKTPAPSMISPALHGHLLVRQRYIDQKRRACMDQKALNEIFMIKAPV